MENNLFLKPLPAFPHVLAADFVRSQDKMPEWQVKLFHELLYLAKKCYEIERDGVYFRNENIKLKQEIEFLYDVVNNELNGNDV